MVRRRGGYRYSLRCATLRDRWNPSQSSPSRTLPWVGDDESRNDWENMSALTFSLTAAVAESYIVIVLILLKGLTDENNGRGKS